MSYAMEIGKKISINYQRECLRWHECEDLWRGFLKSIKFILNNLYLNQYELSLSFRKFLDLWISQGSLGQAENRDGTPNFLEFDLL